MIRNYALPLLAAAGFFLAIVAVARDYAPEARAAYTVKPIASPFSASVAGAGIIEASTENIAVGTPVAGIVTEIYVKPGDAVNAGDPLFKIDDRDLQGQILPAAAKVKVAEANYKKAKDHLDRGESLSHSNKSAISEEDMANRRSDAAIAAADVAAAQAQVDQIKIEIERRTVRALVAGTIMQVKTRLGEYAQTGGVSDPPLMLLGNDKSLHIRVDVDENDAGRVKADAKAVAFPRGSPALQIPLKFVRIEPYILPKASLTGVGTERVDTRVLQVIYSFDPDKLPVYAGEQVDVFIDATEGNP